MTDEKTIEQDQRNTFFYQYIMQSQEIFIFSASKEDKDTDNSTLSCNQNFLFYKENYLNKNAIDIAIADCKKVYETDFSKTTDVIDVYNQWLEIAKKRQDQNTIEIILSELEKIDTDVTELPKIKEQIE